MRVRTVANKSKMKVSIIQSIDRKVALDDIALAKGIEFDELLDEVESIVYSGTKLNIDYFLEEVLDDDKVDDIYEYFKESETDDIDEAIDELGDDYSEEEIRLVRIKFISEMANWLYVGVGELKFLDSFLNRRAIFVNKNFKV